MLQVFSVFAENGISVDVVATSEVSISLTLDPSKLWERELIEQVSNISLAPGYHVCHAMCILSIVVEISFEEETAARN